MTMANVRDPSGTTLSHFGFCKLVVDDLDRAAAFYRAVFGLVDWQRLAHENSATTGGPIDEITFHATDMGGPSLTLIKFVDRGPPPVGETVLGFHTTDLEALVERARVAGGVLARPIRDLPEHGLKVGFVADPEGHLIEIFSRYA
jgi:predicted enzyme related to lactoylglutathione lyase